MIKNSDFFFIAQFSYNSLYICHYLGESSGGDDTVVIHSTPISDPEGDAAHAFHSKMVLFYQTLAFWIDEPRLHDPNLYLPALPPQYEAERLLTLFHNQQVT